MPRCFSELNYNPGTFDNYVDINEIIPFNHKYFIFPIKVIRSIQRLVHSDMVKVEVVDNTNEQGMYFSLSKEIAG